MRVAQLVFVLIVSAFSATAQTDTCNCIANLDQTIRKTEENYAGYPAKRNNAYPNLVMQLRLQAAKVTTPKPCYYLLRDYVRFFKDKHFIISYNAGKNFDSTVVALSHPIEKPGSITIAPPPLPFKNLKTAPYKPLK